MEAEAYDEDDEEEAQVEDDAFGNNDRADRFRQDDQLANDLFQQLRNNKY